MNLINFHSYYITNTLLSKLHLYYLRINQSVIINRVSFVHQEKIWDNGSDKKMYNAKHLISNKFQNKVMARIKVIGKVLIRIFQELY